MWGANSEDLRQGGRRGSEGGIRELGSLFLIVKRLQMLQVCILQEIATNWESIFLLSTSSMFTVQTSVPWGLWSNIPSSAASRFKTLMAEQCPKIAKHERSRIQDIFGVRGQTRSRALPFCQWHVGWAPALCGLGSPNYGFWVWHPELAPLSILTPVHPLTCVNI